MVKQVPVIKNFSETGSACSAAGLGNDLFRLSLEGNSSLLNSLISVRGKDEEHSSLCWEFLSVTVSQVVLCMLLLRAFGNSDMAFKYSAVQHPYIFYCLLLQPSDL